MSNFTEPARRARRLVRWYPVAWRQRYGAEFEDLLESEIDDKTHSAKRFASVAWGGLRARLAYVGLVDDVLEPSQQRSASLVVLVVGFLAYLTFGVVTWSKFQFPGNFQFVTLQGRSGALGIANLVMSWAFAGLLVIAILAAAPLWFFALRQSLRQRSKRLGARLLALPASTALLAFSFLRFDATMRNLVNPRSPGNANIHPPFQVFQSFVLVRTILGHPSLLIHERPDVRTMSILAFLQLFALIFMVFGVTTLIRRIDLPLKVIFYELRLSQMALAFMMAACVSTFVALFASSSLRPAGIYANQHLAEGSVTVMTIALLVAGLAAFRTRDVRNKLEVVDDSL